MSIVSLQNCLDFMDIDSSGTFTITAANDVMVLTSDQGAANIDCDDGTYSGTDLATELQTQMNADATLTGGTITFVVSYSSSTYKFTIDATAGHTIAYTDSGSDAGLTFGFDDDHAAAQTITSDNAVPGDPSDIVTTILNGIDEWANYYCNREFDSTTYAEFYDGTGDQYLYLDQYPITAITQIAIGRDEAIKVKNTATDATIAYVVVDSLNVTLIVSGGASESSSALVKLTYTTLSDMVDAINALGNGWSAEIYDSDYNNIKSTQLCPCMAKYCGARANTTAGYEYLEIPAEPIVDFRFDADSGEIYYPRGFPKGYQNVFAGFSAGYNAAAMPYDLELAILIAVKSVYDRRNEETFNVSEFSLGHLRVKYADVLPPETIATLNRYKRMVV